VELWLGRILAKCKSLSGKGRMNTNDSVYIPGSTDCDLSKAYITKTWLADSHHRDVVLDVTFHILKQLLWREINLVPAIEQMWVEKSTVTKLLRKMNCGTTQFDMTVVERS